MPIDVLTNRYTSSRAGVNSAENQLTKTRIDSAAFGKLFTRTVDGDLYAQPLIVSDLTIRGELRNVVYLATSRNWVYAYDADDPAAYLPLWTRQLGQAVPRDEIEAGYLNFGSEVGITSTPAIMRTATGGTLFVTAKAMTRGADGGASGFDYKLHALDIVTGRNRHRPVLIKARLAGRPDVRFDPLRNLNRPGLLLQNGIIYLAFGSHDDSGTYFGWIMAYQASTLAQIAVYNTAPDWGEGGVWQSGTGLAGDASDCVYAVVGNGQKPSKNRSRLPPMPPPAAVTVPNYGNSLLKLQLKPGKTSRAFQVISWFTASDVFDLNEKDTDFVGGPVLFDWTKPDGTTGSYLLGGGKDGKFYVAERSNLGGWVPPGQPPKLLQAARLCAYHIHGAPVVWQTQSNTDVRAYVWSEKDALREFRFSATGFGPAPASSSNYRLPDNELRMPGGVLALSWDGNDPDTGILWAVHSTREDAMNKTVAGTLRAFDPLNLLKELWTSDMDAAGADRLGNLAKFSPPVVANGKVYVGTFSRELAVYGLFDDCKTRFDSGIFELRDIGPNVTKAGGLAEDRYHLRLTGAGIGEVREGFLFANLERNPSYCRISIEASVEGIDAPAFPNACAGLIMRRNFDPWAGTAALVVGEDGTVRFLTREQPPPLHDLPDPPVVAATVEGSLAGAPFPIKLRLTVEGILSTPGAVTVIAEAFDPAAGGYVVIGRPVDMLLDGAASMNLKLGLFATAQSAHPVPVAALPAYARFAQVTID